MNWSTLFSFFLSFSLSEWITYRFLGKQMQFTLCIWRTPAIVRRQRYRKCHNQMKIHIDENWAETINCQPSFNFIVVLWEESVASAFWWCEFNFNNQFSRVISLKWFIQCIIYTQYLESKVYEDFNETELSKSANGHDKYVYILCICHFKSITLIFLTNAHHIWLIHAHVDSRIVCTAFEGRW